MKRPRLGAAIGGITVVALAMVLATAGSAQAGGGCSLTPTPDGYVISNEAQLGYVWDCSASATYVLTDDITLSDPFSPIVFGGGSTYFSGTFDGKGHTISGLSISGTFDLGLFKFISGGTVQNLTLSNVRVIGTSGYVGAVAGTASNATIRDVHVTSGTVTAGDNFVGGLVGNLTATTGTTVEDVSSAATVSSTSPFAGGLVGYVEVPSIPGLDVTITRATATGAVTSTGVTGGLIGKAIVEGGHLTIQDATATGAVAGAGDVGGLAGAIEVTCYATPCSADVVRSVASGAITATAANAGGLIGRLAGSCPVPMCAASLAVTDAYASGTVAAASSGGGLLGEAAGAASTTVVLTRTYASGAVTGGKGLVGSASSATATASFWNPTDSTTASSALGTAATATTMRSRALYADAGWPIVAGWQADDPSRRWGICSEIQGGLPYLLRAYTTAPCSAPAEPPATTPTTAAPATSVTGPTSRSGSIRVGRVSMTPTGFSLRATVDGAGLISLIGTRSGGTRASTVACRSTRRVGRPGTFTVACTFNASTLRALRSRALVIAWKAAFVPTSGNAATQVGRTTAARIAPARPTAVTG